MMGHKICFYGKIWLIIPKLSLLPLLIWSTAYTFQYYVAGHSSSFLHNVTDPVDADCHKAPSQPRLNQHRSRTSQRSKPYNPREYQSSQIRHSSSLVEDIQNNSSLLSTERTNRVRVKGRREMPLRDRTNTGKLPVPHLPVSCS